MAVRIKKDFCVGLDIHKDNAWCACVAHLKGQDDAKHHVRMFNANHTDLTAMCDWIKEIYSEYEKNLRWYVKSEEVQIHVFMESTGKYSIPVYNVLEENGLIPHIVNPKNCRVINGQKVDQKDCDWIAELGSWGLLMDSFVPEREIREARDISRRRTKLVQDRADEIRRILNVLVISNFRVDLIFSDISGQSAMRVINYFLKTDKPEFKMVESLIDGKCKIKRFKSDEERKEKEDQLLKSFKGAKFSYGSKLILESALKHIDSLNHEVDSLEESLTRILADHEVNIDLLTTIPGISVLSAKMILAEIGGDVSAFKNCSQFVNWCGLCPASNSSNGKHKSVKIGKGGKYLKPVLVQCVLSAVKSDPYLKAKYCRIAGRRGKKRALIAIGRKILIGIYYMLLTGSVWDPSDKEEVLDTWEAQQEMKEIQKTNKQLSKALSPKKKVSGRKNVNLAIVVLEKYGFDPETIKDLKLKAVDIAC